MVLGVGEPSNGLVTRPSMSEKLWHSCTELATRALTDAFVSQLAAGTLQEISFQHYIAQDAFFLAAFDKAYERAQDHVEDVGAKESLQELRESVLEELQLHEGYAKAWDIDLEDYAEPSLATKNYIDFLNQMTGASPTSSGASLAVQGKRRDPSLTDALDADRTSCHKNVLTRGSQAESSGRGGTCRLNDTEEIFERRKLGRGGRDSHVDTAEKSAQDRGVEGGSEYGGGLEGNSSQDCEISGARIVAAMVPCMRLYAFLGAELSQGRELEGHPYREWIETYASPAFQASAAKLEAVLESACGPNTEFEALLQTYKKAMLLEVEFFAAQPHL